MAKLSNDPVIAQAAARGLSAKKALEYSRPPEAVRDNTKARRAWLDAEVARIEAVNVAGELPTVKAKITGAGSYQTVSVTRYTYGEAAELRYRGVCQYCGHLHVVQGPANDPTFETDAAKVAAEIVLHGYQRPGWGYIFGRCPAVGKQPLNFSDVATRGYLEADRAKLPEFEADAETLRLVMVKAEAERAASGEYLYASRPSRPSEREAARRPEVAAKYQADVAAFIAKYPKTHAFNVAQANAREAAGHVQACKGRIEHFEGLLASGTLGTPLHAEVAR